MACDRDTTLAAACTSGIGKLQSKIQLLQAWAQLLCTGFAPPGAASLTLDDGINPPTIIFNPTGAYDLTGQAWVSAVAVNATGITSLIFGNNPALTSISITGSPALQNLQLINTHIVALNLSNQTSINQLVIQSNTLMTSVNLSALTSATADFYVNLNVLLTTLTVSALATVTGSIFLNGNTALTTVSFPALTSFIGNFSLATATSLTSVSLPALTSGASGGSGQSLTATSSAALASFTIPAIWPFTNNFTLNLSGGALNLTSVNLILTSAYAAAPAITTDTIDVSGGTNAAPTGTGLADAFLLRTAGNTVLFNVVAMGFNSLVVYNSTSTVASTFTTGAYTPTANALCLAFVFNSTGAVITSITGNGLTWVLVDFSNTTTGNIQGLRVYRAMGASPTNTGLTVNLSGATSAGIIIHVQEYTGAKTGGTNGSEAVWQQFANLSNTITIAPLNTNSLNACVGASVIAANPTGATLEGSWTQDVNQAQTPSFSVGAFVAHRMATTDASFNSSMAGNVASVAMEIVSMYSSNSVPLPSSIANLEIWSSTSGGVYQDAAKAVPCTNGTTVYTWDNQGNTAVVSDWIQATAGSRPTYSTGGQNGKPKITFNNKKMSNTCGNFAQPFTSIVVATYSGNVGGAGVLVGDGIGLACPSVIDPSAFGYIYLGSGVVSGTIAVTSTPFLMVGIGNGASSALYTNTVANLSGNPGALQFTSPFYMGKHVADAFYIIGDFYEQMFFSRVLTSAELCMIQIYCRQTYALDYT